MVKDFLFRPRAQGPCVRHLCGSTLLRRSFPASPPVSTLLPRLNHVFDPAASHDTTSSMMFGRFEGTRQASAGTCPSSSIDHAPCLPLLSPPAGWRASGESHPPRPPRLLLLPVCQPPRQERVGRQHACLLKRSCSPPGEEHLSSKNNRPSSRSATAPSAHGS